MLPTHNAPELYRAAPENHGDFTIRSPSPSSSQSMQLYNGNIGCESSLANMTDNENNIETLLATVMSTPKNVYLSIASKFLTTMAE